MPIKPKGVYYLRLQNVLRNKASGGTIEPRVKGELPLDLIEEAERQLEESTLEFKSGVIEYLSKLSRFCTEALTETGSRHQYFSNIQTLAMRLRGQGTTFGYPLISTIATMLYQVTGKGCAEDDKAVKVAEHHIESMRAVIREETIGDGGEVGRQLVRELQMNIKEAEISR
jgi:hypothetical protein